MQLAVAVRELAGIVRRRDANLASQLNRAAVSVAANIAEGYGRSGRGEYLHFLSIASGSTTEVETLTLLTGRAGLAPDDKFHQVLALSNETGRILLGLRRSLAPEKKKGPKWPLRAM